MVVVDAELDKREREGRPIRIGMVGAGYVGRGIAAQLFTPVRGMRLSAVSNRTVSRARQLFTDLGTGTPLTAGSLGQLEDAVEVGRPVVTDDPDLICRAGNIDVVIETTGHLDFGAKVAQCVIGSGKHLVLNNIELDSTVGPLLKNMAAGIGAVITGIDGDEPGVAMNLMRSVKALGFEPVLAGNIKGLLDHYRNPETQEEFARKTGQDPYKVASYADGTKLAMELAVLGNASGFKPGRLGCFGPRCGDVTEVLDLFPPEKIRPEGMVDYILGAAPYSGIFVVARCDDPIKAAYLESYKMGSGPDYLFYTPYHLPVFQMASTVARAVIFGDPTVTPAGAPVCAVAAAAKRDLKKGEVLDGLGGFCSYGLVDSYEQCRRKGWLPIGLAEGCRLKKDYRQDELIEMDDVVLPEGRETLRLWREQEQVFTVQNS